MAPGAAYVQIVAYEKGKPIPGRSQVWSWNARIHQKPQSEDGWRERWKLSEHVTSLPPQLAKRLLRATNRNSEMRHRLGKGYEVLAKFIRRSDLPLTAREGAERVLPATRRRSVHPSHI